MQEHVTKRQIPLPTVDYFAAFNVSPTASVTELVAICSDMLRKVHPDNPDTGERKVKVTTEEIDTVVKALKDLRALSKNPDAFAAYQQKIIRSRGLMQPEASQSDEPRPPQFHQEGDYYLGKTQVRPVRGGALISGGHPFYKIVNPFTGEVMGSRAFIRFHEVAGQLVGTYSVGMGRREILVDRHTGEGYGQSFSRIFMKGNNMCGDAFGVIRHIVDPKFGTVSEYIVDLKV